MRASTFLLACGLMTMALVALPAELAPTAAASCTITGDPVQDLQCQAGCYPDPTDVKAIVQGRVCPR